jgi:5-methylcytosine-specific restriction protein B
LPHVELDSRVREELIALAAKLKGEEKLLAEGHLKKYVEVFRDRFGPSQLGGLDGAELLEKVHNQSNRDSLVYWLEFKNDDEFPTPKFGSIAGGSALKFTIFYRKDSGSWMGRSPGNVPVEITPEEALKSARKHRDQLLAGIDLLQALPADATDSDYEGLQAAMDSKAPDVSDLAWGHKYFSLLFAEKLDDYHNADLQRFHLVKLLQLPPDKRGRYVLAGWYVDLARQLGLHMNQLTSVLNVRDGRQHRYWRIGTSEGDNDPVFWPAMRDGNYVAVGWPKLGDLAPVFAAQEPKTELKRLLSERHPNTPQVTGKSAAEISRFMKEMDEGDVVVAANGTTILGVGKVEANSQYRHEPTDDFPHRRPIAWLDQDSWKMPQQEALRTTFKELRIPENLVAIERRIVRAVPKKATPVTAVPTSVTIPRMAGVAGRVQSILERKGQVILYGPPGTGKTYWAERTARDLAAWRQFGEPFAQLDASRRAVFDNEGLVRTCTFHPSYGYEDFLEGYRPQLGQNGQLAFNLRDGIFKRLCNDASQKPDSHYYLVVDEINRGDIPRIFGELLTVLEKSKRGRTVHLAVSGDPFQVPANVFLVGTMNTADRSIALLDKALRRRFGFVECMPDPRLLDDMTIQGVPLGPWLDLVNRNIRQKVGRDARNLQIGHSYLMDGERPISEFSRFAQVLQDEIIPLLEEYCYEDYPALAEILGTGLVDAINQRIREELFEDARRDDLVQALLQPYPEIATSRQAIASDVQAATEEEEAIGTGAEEGR